MHNHTSVYLLFRFQWGDDGVLQNIPQRYEFTLASAINMKISLITIQVLCNN